MLIYHIVLPDIWETSKDAPVYEADSLATEGFIHCSYRAQLDAVLRRYYQDREKVLILTLEPDLLTAELIAEPSTGGEVYPHIYGAINREAIVAVEEKFLK